MSLIFLLCYVILLFVMLLVDTVRECNGSVMSQLVLQC